MPQHQYLDPDGEVRPVDRELPLLDALNAARRVTRSAVYNLTETAQALARVGLTAVADEIAEQLPALDHAARQLQVSYNADMDRQLAHGAAMSGGLLQLGLRMVELEHAAQSGGAAPPAAAESCQ